MEKYKIFVIFIITCLSYFRLCSQTFEPGNKISVGVKTTVQRNSSFQFEYSYTISSMPQSIQNVWACIVVTMLTQNNISGISSPPKWEFGIPDNTPTIQIRWSTIGGEIFPGNNLSGFQFAAIGLPCIVNYYAEGYHGIPKWPESVEDDSIPGYDDLTPYGPGVVGKTIGPAPIPEPFYHTAFLDTLVSYTQQAYDLQWLSDSHFLSRINRDLTQAKRTLDRGDSARCASEIISFQQTIQTEYTSTTQQKGKHIPYVSNEAYYLLYYNAQYLVDRLPRSTK
jgi:hypothetical protein